MLHKLIDIDPFSHDMRDLLEDMDAIVDPDETGDASIACRAYSDRSYELVLCYSGRYVALLDWEDHDFDVDYDAIPEHNDSWIPEIERLAQELTEFLAGEA